MWYALAAVAFVVIMGAWGHSNSQRSRAKRWKRTGRLDGGTY